MLMLGRTHTWEVSVAQSVILAIAFLFPFFQTPEPGARHELLLRLRYPDGRPAAGVAVILLKLPDRAPVGWQNTDSACQTDAQGLCGWQLFGGLYEFSFPEGLAPDPITRTELGEGGLNNLSVFLDRDYAMGIVLADPLTASSGKTLFFDQAPDEAVPQFFIPGPEDARQHHLVPTAASNVVIVDLNEEASTPARTEEALSNADGSADQGQRVILLVMLAGLISLIAVAVFINRHLSQVHARATALHQVGDPEDEESGPWA
jgi:hypothetical protein